MKCVQCGEELKEGSLFCSNCGKEVQIVPDYNEYEDDYLKRVLAEANRPKRRQTSKAPRAEGRARSKKKLTVILASAAAAVLVILVTSLTAWTNMKKRQANSFDYQIEMAEKAYRQGDIDTAVSYYENALSLDKDNIDVRLILAEISMDRNDFDSALILCQEIMKMDSANKRACEILIEIYEDQKNYDAVLALYEAVDGSLKDLFLAYLVTPPVFSLEAGTYDEFMTVELSADGDYEIYYSMDGSDPILRGSRYMLPIELKENLKTYTVEAVCMNQKGIYSDVVSKEYRIDIPAPDMPIVTPDGGDFGVETTIAVTVPDGCSAYYTWDGSDPTINSKLYAGPIMIIEGNNVLSVIIVDNTTNLYSDIYRGNFVYYPDIDEGEGLSDSLPEDGSELEKDAGEEERREGRAQG